MRLVTDNLVLKSIITSSSVDVHFPLENLKNTLRSKRMRTTSNENQWVLFDIGAIDLGEESAEVSNVDSVVLLLPKEGTITFSGSQIIKIQANDTDDWDNPPVDVNLSLDSTRRQATHYFETPLNYRYWRLTMTDPTSTVDYFEISKVILG